MLNMRGFRLITMLLLAGTMLSPAPVWSQGTLPPALLIPQQTKPPVELQPLTKPFVSEYDIDLIGTAQPAALLVLRDGTMAFTAFNLGAVGRIDADRRKVSYVSLGKAAKPVGLVEGPDGALYATDKALNVIHRIAAETGEVSRIAMPPDAPKLDLAGLRIDFDGKLWFAGVAGWLGSHDLATGHTEVSSHDDLQGLGLSTITETGAILFVAGKSGRMIRLEPKRARFDSSALPNGFRGARGIAVDGQGLVWLSSYRRNLIARQTGRGQWQVIEMPWPESQPQAILHRRDGSVLIADGARRVLYRYTPSLNRFDEVGQLGEGGQIKAMVEIPGGVAIADMGADRIRLFLEEPAKAN